MVVTAVLEGKAHILDPDVGLVIPRWLQDIERDPSFARAAYASVIDAMSMPAEKKTWRVDMITNYYASATTTTWMTPGVLDIIPASDLPRNGTSSWSCLPTS